MRRRAPNASPSIPRGGGATSHVHKTGRPGRLQASSKAASGCRAATWHYILRRTEHGDPWTVANDQLLLCRQKLSLPQHAHIHRSDRIIGPASLPQHRLPYIRESIHVLEGREGRALHRVLKPLSNCILKPSVLPGVVAITVPRCGAECR